MVDDDQSKISTQLAEMFVVAGQAKNWGRKYKCEERGESGTCDSREMPVVWARSDPTDAVAQTSPNHPAKMAAVRLVGTLSNRDAVGAHWRRRAAGKLTAEAAEVHPRPVWR